MTLTLSARPPFSLTTVARSHGWIKLAPFSEIDNSGGLTYIDRLGTGRVVEVVIQETSNGVKVNMDSQLDEAEQAEIAQKVTWMLGLNQDFSAFYTLIRGEPKLAKVEDRAQGRVLRSPTFFEDVVKTILTTNTTWGGTIRMVKNLVSQFGTPLPGDTNRHTFPAPKQIARTSIETLRNQTRLGYRAAYIHELAEAVVWGALDIEEFKNTDLPTLELRKQLLAIRGVGEYAAANLLMLLGRYDYIPIDSWALKMVSQEWYNGQKIGRRQVEAAFRRWEKWKGLAFWFWDWSYQG